MDKVRIAVLGSGPAALAAVWEITESPGWNERFEIDLYAMGWRLGGKAASGRNAAHRFRNEEHGLHILGGFYHNTFQQLRPLYAAWNANPEDRPLPFAEAFFPHGSFSIMQREPGAPMRETRFEVAGDEREPGIDPEELSLAAIIQQLLRWTRLGFVAISEGLQPFAASDQPADRPLAAKDALPFEMAELAALAGMLGAAEEAADRLGKPGAGGADAERLIADSAASVLGWIEDKDNGMFPVENADWLGLAGLALVIARGLAVDRVYATGFQSIDRYDAREWLARHGATDRILRNGNYMAGYSYAFAFTDGDPERGDFAAGTALRAYLRMLFASHGNIFFHMCGGMGEIFVLPYYDVLRRRGVRFHFFHKVVELRPDGTGNLGEIEFQLQAESLGDYDPVLAYRPDPAAPERRSWPTEPFWEQLRNGEALREADLDLESFFGPVPPGASAKRLAAGDDFDLCILAIPPGVLRTIAAPLAADSSAWRRMLDSAGTAPTLAAQCWRDEQRDSFGGLSSRGLMTAHELPLDTWADMSFLLPLEQGDGEGVRPASLSYFCGAVPLPDHAPPDGMPSAERRRATELVQNWMGRHLGTIFPGLADAGDVVAPDIERISLVNSDPAKLYITSPAGSTVHRLAPDASGFGNLFLAGDWTRHNFDCGAVESAVMSARVCARAICGHPQAIYGESDRV